MFMNIFLEKRVEDRDLLCQGEGHDDKSKAEKITNIDSSEKNYNNTQQLIKNMCKCVTLESKVGDEW